MHQTWLKLETIAREDKEMWLSMSAKTKKNYNQIAQEIAEEFEDVEVDSPRSTTCKSIYFQCGIKLID